MKKNRKLAVLFLIVIYCLLPANIVYSQNEIIQVIKFKEVDIKIVLQSIAQKAYKEGKKINIVVGPEVEGLISISLEEVDWFTALEAIIRPYNYSYEWVGENIILVDTTEKISEREALAKARQEVEPARTKVYRLKFIDANDARKMIEPLLSPVGRISVLETTGQAGWEFGGDVTKRERAKEGKASRTKLMVISDIAKKLDEIEVLLDKIDVMPRQVLIQTKLVEVNHDKLVEIGFNWGTGTGGSADLSTTRQEVTTYYATVDDDGYSIKETYADILALQKVSMQTGGGQVLGTQFLPVAGIFELIFQKLTGTQFEIVMKALEEKSYVNVLSSPHILTINNQEASILIGSKFPLIKTSVSSETGAITGQSLDRYQDIGIQLNVVPQILDDGEYINLIVHPAVSSYTQTVKAVSSSGTIMAEYPIIIVREAETQILMKNGETVVIGGLMKDVETRTTKGIPVLKDLPVLGRFFRHESVDVSKIDLLIFITAKIVEPGKGSVEEIIRKNTIPAGFKFD